MCMTDEAEVSDLPEISPESAPLLSLIPAEHRSVGAVTEASNIVPAPAALGKAWQAIPDEVVLTARVAQEADFSWTTKAAASASSMLPTELPVRLPASLHAYSPRDPTPYTQVPLPVGGVHVEPISPFQQSLLTAKDRLSKLGRLDFSTLSMSLDIPWEQEEQQAQPDNAKPDMEASSFSTLSTFGTVDSSMEEEAFPETASKIDGMKAGSSRDMGSLEWLNLCSGPPKAGFLMQCHSTCTVYPSHAMHATQRLAHCVCLLHVDSLPHLACIAPLFAILCRMASSLHQSVSEQQQHCSLAELES